MEYKFYKQTISKTTFVEVDCNINVLNRFGDSNWTSEKVQEIIDGVKSTDNTEKEYRWANEDVMLISNKHAVFFIDLISMRATRNKAKEKQDLDLTHNEFLKFLNDFKVFLEKDSGK